MVYESLVRSHLTYGLVAWGIASRKGDIKKLQVLQKACVRVIAGARRLDHTEPLFKQLGILKLDDLVAYSALGMTISLQSKANEDNNLKRYVRNIETSSRRGFTLQPLLKSSSLNYHVGMWNKHFDLVSMDLTKQTRKKWLREQFLSTYKDAITCDRDQCHSCKLV